MSLFRVKLINSATDEGNMDTGNGSGVSIQRDARITLPGLGVVVVKDGDEIIGPNYLKQFVPVADGGTAVNDGFLEIVSDDGTYWDSTQTGPLTTLMGDTLSVAPGSDFGDDPNASVFFNTFFGTTCTALMLRNTGTVTVRVRLNEGNGIVGLDGITHYPPEFNLDSGDTRIYENNGQIYAVELASPDSSGDTGYVEYDASIIIPITVTKV